MRTHSVKERFAITFLTSILTSGISFLTTLFCARELGPESYGDFTFLSASFVAFKQIADLGTSNAFYTFMCQTPRSIRFVAGYFGWQILQMFVIALFIRFVIPIKVVHQIWIGLPRSLILLAFFAIFIRQQIWVTVTQIADSLRITFRGQMLYLTLIVLHLALVIGAQFCGILNLRTLFWLLIAEFTIGATVSPFFLSLRKILPATSLENSFNAVLKAYWNYCTPMVFYSLICAGFGFLDNWLLQKFGGAKQSAFFSVANQYSTISILATTAMLNIYWKEIAESFAQENFARVSELWKRSSRFLFFIAVLTSTFFIPWAREITAVSIGPAYLESANTIAIMLLYPLHQVMGHLTSTLFLATGRTRAWMIYGSLFMLLSSPFSYLVLAPPSAFIPGLGLGSRGLAIKMVVCNILNFVAVMFWIKRTIKSLTLSFDWLHQPVLFIAGISCSYVCSYLFRRAFSSLYIPSGKLSLLPMIPSLALFLVIMMAGVWNWPTLVGLRPSDLQGIRSKLRFYLFS